jgi:hypothetical protein
MQVLTTSAAWRSPRKRHARSTPARGLRSTRRHGESPPVNPETPRIRWDRVCGAGRRGSVRHRPLYAPGPRGTGCVEPCFGWQCIEAFVLSQVRDVTGYASSSLGRKCWRQCKTAVRNRSTCGPCRLRATGYMTNVGRSVYCRTPAKHGDVDDVAWLRGDDGQTTGSVGSTRALARQADLGLQSAAAVAKHKCEGSPISGDARWECLR